MESEQIEPPKVYNGSTQNSTINHEVSISSGLPNLMNTCFLNSILQQLYQIAIIQSILASQNQVIDVDQYDEEQDLLICLKALFRMMRENSPDYDKRLMLAKIRNHMTKKLLDYQAGSQYDSFQTFTCIFDYLAQRRPELYQHFEMEYNQSCECPYDAINFAATTIEDHKIMCLQCKSQIKRQFVTLPSYLVVNYEKGSSEGGLANKLQNQECYYTLESRNIYNGSGRFGHYYSECRFDGIFYTFDDNSQVRLSSKDQKNKCLFAVYKKNLKNSDTYSSNLKKKMKKKDKTPLLTRKKVAKSDQRIKEKGLHKIKRERINRPKLSLQRQKNQLYQPKYVKKDHFIQLNEADIRKAQERLCYCHFKSIFPQQLKFKTVFEKIMQFLKSHIFQRIFHHLVLRIRMSRNNKISEINQKIEIIEKS